MNGPDGKTTSAPPDSLEELLRSSARLARLVLRAHAASVFLHAPEADELVMRATSQADADWLLGLSIPAGSGIAGWVFESGEGVSVRNVVGDARFQLEVAASTGFVPVDIVAAPVVAGDRTVGVLEVLDPTWTTENELATVDIVTEVASGLGASLDLIGRGSSSVRFPESERARVLRDDLVDVIDAALDRHTCRAGQRPDPTHRGRKDDPCI